MKQAAIKANFQWTIWVAIRGGLISLCLSKENNKQQD
jgi:hypothetical protein